MSVGLAGCVARNSGTPNSTFDTPAVDGPLNAENLAEKNRKIHQEYLRIDADSPAEIEIVNATMRNKLLLDAKSHPVARLDQLENYDPQKLTGFCFGRAMAVHLLGRQRGINPESIKKQFIVGDLRGRRSAQTEWRFHVTTLVRGENDVWYAIDPIFPAVMTQTEWIQKTRKIWDEWYLDRPLPHEPQSRLYVVGRHEILPDIRTFVPPDQETGNNMIELKFVPENREGFSLMPDLGKKVFSLDNAAAEKYFLTSSEESQLDLYNYLGLAFNDGFFIDYNDYFQHLLFGIPTEGPAALPLLTRRDISDDAIEASSDETPGSVSFDFNKIQQLKDEQR
jgi:hypothetical protein